jgi:hypothetical protein
LRVRCNIDLQQRTSTSTGKVQRCFTPSMLKTMRYAMPSKGTCMSLKKVTRKRSSILLFPGPEEQSKEQEEEKNGAKSKAPQNNLLYQRKQSAIDCGYNGHRKRVQYVQRPNDYPRRSENSRSRAPEKRHMKIFNQRHDQAAWDLFSGKISSKWC